MAATAAARRASGWQWRRPNSNAGLQAVVEAKAMPMVITRSYAKTPPKPKPQPAYLFAKNMEEVDYCPRTSAARLRTTNLISYLWISSYRSPDKTHHNLERFLHSPDLWHCAYQRSCYNRGLWAPTSRIDQETLADLDNLKRAVMDGTFAWGGKEQIFVFPPPKPGSDPPPIRQRDDPRGDFQDEIVQEVLIFVLEPLFEVRLSQRAFGGRPGRSAQSCLRYIQGNFDGVVWTVKGDLTKLYDDPQPELITRVLANVVQDSRVIELIASGLRGRLRLEVPIPRPVRVSYRQLKQLSEDKKPKRCPFWLDTVLGFAPVEAQKSPKWGYCHKLAPLLANIYLNELDSWMEGQMSEFFRPHDPNLGMEPDESPQGDYLWQHKKEPDSSDDEETYRNTPYIERRHYEDSSSSSDDEEGGDGKGGGGSPPPNPRLEQQLAVVAGKELMSDNSKRMEYIRYSGHFLISVRGTRHDALRAVERCRAFCRETFFTEPDLDPPVHITRRTFFLGHEIFRRRLIITRRQLFSDNRYRTLKLHKTILCVKADMQYCLHKLREVGVLKGDDHPLACMRLFHTEQAQTNAHMNKLLRALADWYKYAFNRKAVCGLIGYVFRSSLAKMYAAKYKLRSQAKVYKTASSDLSYQLKDRKGRTPQYRQAVVSGMKTGIEPIEFRFLDRIPEAVFSPLPRNWMPVHERLLREFASLKEPQTMEAELEAMRDKEPAAVRERLSSIVWESYRGGTASMANLDEDLAKKKLRHVTPYLSEHDHVPPPPL
ncbi:nuclear intron maturase 2, mitochondrial-like [Selaginella moellendorffii]|uniref:nuclear intron maturase 2, mitochondrial-like n=1 Tax=Selaginella moellendorffii TaxID=88036 RepID=UPI000D1CC0A8|nr:nuclear intron maturase 2, mitochondrial-like [Selaginella moellendorffii]|eukprot:XP_024524785.1 nuclear intron maturase 2, mitochondrial-like [Selaginella moellendorffii]